MQELTAKDVMNRTVMAVRAAITVRELAKFLAEKQITGAPVADEEGKLVGVVSLMDIAESRAEGVDAAAAAAAMVHGQEPGVSVEDLEQLVVDAEAKVGDIMTPAVYTIDSSTPVSRMAKTMVSGRIHRLFVTEDERIVGIVTSLDLVKLLCKDEPS